MRFEIQEPGERGILTFDGDLTIVQSEEIRKAMLDALRSVNRLEYVVKNATSVDLSFLQLLCSFHKTAVHMGKEVVQGAESSSKTLSDVVNIAGFVRHIGYNRESLNTCLWLADNEKQE